jgi:hypothetical protein
MGSNFCKLIKLKVRAKYLCSYLLIEHNGQDGGLESVNLRSGEVSVNAMIIIALTPKDSPCGEYASPQFNFATMICASNNPAATTIGEFQLFL